MSMILDALTRAEHERQIENQPDLKFATPVKSGHSKPSNIWMWVFLALIANAVVLAVFLRPGSNSTQPTVDETTEIMAESGVNENKESIQTPTEIITSPLAGSESKSTDLHNVEVMEANASSSSESPATRPLAMELEEKTPVETDRPLIYEAKQANASLPSKANRVPNSTLQTENSGKDVGGVSFSETELSVDETAVPITNAPKLLIDQGDSRPSTTYAPSLKELPESSRSNLKQYEVNVHVFDDNPERRFVLINMDKYKEGERIANNGPLIQEITREGVIVDYGEGRALLPPK